MAKIILSWNDDGGYEDGAIRPERAVRVLSGQAWEGAIGCRVVEAGEQVVLAGGDADEGERGRVGDNLALCPLAGGVAVVDGHGVMLGHDFPTLWVDQVNEMAVIGGPGGQGLPI